MTHVFKKSLMMAALVAAFAVAQAGSAMAQLEDGDAQAVLDLNTGEVTVEFGSGLLIFGIEGIAFDNAAAATPLLAIDPTTLGTQNDAGGIGVVSFSGLPVGLFSLGNIIPEGSRTEAGIALLNFRFDGPSATGTAVSAPGNITVVPADPQGVPEPGSLSLLALAGLGAVARRRR